MALKISHKNALAKNETKNWVSEFEQNVSHASIALPHTLILKKPKKQQHSSVLIFSILKVVVPKCGVGVSEALNTSRRGNNGTPLSLHLMFCFVLGRLKIFALTVDVHANTNPLTLKLWIKLSGYSNTASSLLWTPLPQWWGSLNAKSLSFHLESLPTFDRFFHPHFITVYGFRSSSLLSAASWG